MEEPGAAGLSAAHALLEQLRDELIGRTYQPLPARRQEIPKDGGKVRVLSIPAIRDRVVQGALKLRLKPVLSLVWRGQEGT
jgi:RNA-directed DNA polymerase